MAGESDLYNEFLIDLNSERNIFNYVNNGILVTDKHSSIIYTNPTFSRITGYSKEEVLGKNPGILHSGQHGQSFYKEMWKNIIDHGFWEGEIWNRRKSCEIYPELLTISKITRNNINDPYYVAVFSDITFLKKDIHKKLHLAFYDPLTQLPNRNLYFDRVSQMLGAVKSDPTRIENITIMYMDLDKFKRVNDTYGHCVGDKLLKMVGKRLASIIRPSDVVARIGGDEFTALLMSVNNQLSVSKLAERIVENIEKPFIIDNHQIQVSISIGVSLFPKDATTVDLLIAKADKAMYKAKISGSRIAYYDHHS
jgi:diguanylate cyclase (GGDEF)-like protein/PAS domain S-box-containing protein